MVFQAHQIRVVGEKFDLDERLEKLGAFLKTDTFKDLDIAEQARLHRQQALMAALSSVLGERIAAF